MDLPSVAQETERSCLSTGHPPAPEVVRNHVNAAVGNFNSDTYEKSRRAPSPDVPTCVPSTIEMRDT